MTSDKSFTLRYKRIERKGAERKAPLRWHKSHKFTNLVSYYIGFIPAQLSKLVNKDYQDDKNLQRLLKSLSLYYNASKTESTVVAFALGTVKTPLQYKSYIIYGTCEYNAPSHLQWKRLRSDDKVKMQEQPADYLSHLIIKGTDKQIDNDLAQEMYELLAKTYDPAVDNALFHYNDKAPYENGIYRNWRTLAVVPVYTSSVPHSNHPYHEGKLYILKAETGTVRTYLRRGLEHKAIELSVDKVVKAVNAFTVSPNISNVTKLDVYPVAREKVKADVIRIGPGRYKHIPYQPEISFTQMDTSRITQETYSLLVAQSTRNLLKESAK